MYKHLAQGITNPLFEGTSYESYIQSSVGGESFLQSVLPNIVGMLFVFGGVAFFFMFVWGAITWVLSGGDKARVENARGRITSALIGLVLLIASIAIIKLLQDFFNIKILSIDIGPLVIQ